MKTLKFPVILSITITTLGISLGWVTSVAAVSWGDCSTEQGTTTIAAGSATRTITPTHVISSVDETFVLAQATGDVNVRQSSNHLVTAEIVVGTGQVLFTRVGTTGTAQVSYSIVQCAGGDKISKVQRGTISLGSGSSSATAALSTAVDLNHTLVLVSTRSNDSTSTDSANIVTANLQDASTVVVQRSSAATTSVSAHYQVVEFPADSGVDVQTGEATLSSGQATNTVSLTTAVDATRSWVSCSYDATNNGLQQTSIACYLSDGATVTVDRGTASAYTNRVRVYVVTWPPDTVTVLSGTQTNDATAADGSQVNDDIAITAPGADINYSFSYVTNTVTGTSNTYPRNRWLNYIYDSGTLRTSFWRSDAAGNTDATTKYWQVINFPLPYHASGWGWIGNSMDGTDGTALISFDCDNLNTYLGTTCKDGTSGTRYDYGVELEHGGCGEDCNVTGQAWIGSYNTSESGTTLGMIDFDPIIGGGATVPPNVVGNDTTTSENELQDAHWNEETGELYGWARVRVLEDYEDSLAGTADDWGWINLRGTVTSGGEYGVQFDIDTLSLSGWGWNGNGTNPGTGTALDGSGLGWVKFDLDTSGTVAEAWLRTTQGNVYSRGGLSSTVDPTAFGEYNATYLILSNGTVTNFSSELGTVISEDLGGVPTDNTSQVFRGDLGSIYVNELIDRATADGTATTGDCTETMLAGATNPLGGAIYYCSGDLTIDSNLTFYNGTATGVGSGTIVVGGDLYINDNLNYYNNAIDQHINNLASVAFIVQGKVQVGTLVTHMVGAYVVLGDADPTTTGVYDFSTGDSTLPLELDGLVMARSFNFERKSLGASQNQPSEDLRYDGRIFANPPSGLEDFASLLPQYQ